MRKKTAASEAASATVATKAAGRAPRPCSTVSSISSIPFQPRPGRHSTMTEAKPAPRADIAASQSRIRCWVCEGSQTYLVKEANCPRELSPRDFLITDMRYGVTGALFRCKSCSFLFCPELADVDRFYQGLEDPGYEQTRGNRLTQMRRVLDHAQKY